MDRNVFVAIALSMSVLLFWGAFFETPKRNSDQQISQKVEQKKKTKLHCADNWSAKNNKETN